MGEGDEFIGFFGSWGEWFFADNYIQISIR